MVDGNIICYGGSDVSVRDTFLEEADRVKESLRGIDPDWVLCSPLTRSSLLAKYCYRDSHEIIQDERLREMSFGTWELRPWKEILGGAEVIDFFRRYIRERTPQGESLEDVKRRLASLLEELYRREDRPQNVVLFCHGGVIGCARALLEGKEPEEIFSTLVPFGAVVRFSVDRF